MSRPSSSYNGARPTITQISNAPQQLVRLVPPQRLSPGTIPAKVQPELGALRIAPAHLHNLHSTTPIAARRPTREAPPCQLPPPLTYQRRPQQPPITSQNQPALVSFLDHTFRSYAERIQSELTNLRSVCTRAIFREQQDKERWRRHCVTFKQERDVARERVRALIGEREAQMARAGAGTGASAEGESGSGSKRPRDEDASSEHGGSRDSTPSSSTAVAISDPEDDSNLYSLPSPSPTYLPLVIDPTLESPRSPPPRCRSADAVLYSSPTITKKRDVTAFDVTITESPTGDRRIPCQPVKKRRRKGSPDSSSSTSTAVEDATSVTIQEQGTCITGVLGKDSVEVEEVGVHDITNRPKANSDPSAYIPPPSPPFKPVTPKIELTHVDLMYVPTNGKLVCRACLLHCNKLPQSTRPSPTSFPTNAQWDLLKNHCMTQHPTECADVARLHPAEVYELRRRLTMRP